MRSSYWMMSKLIYLPMDQETFNYFPTLEQIGGIIGSCKYLR